MDEHEEKVYSFSSLLGRYFLHGIAFSLLFFAVAIFWVFIAVLLVTVGSLIGFIIGIVFLLFLMGALNAGLTGFIWKTTIKMGVTNILAHGILLSVALILVGVPSFIVSYVSPSPATSIVLFLVYALIDGFVARKVALIWEDTGTGEDWSGD